jgi:hypothetical protein
MAGYFTSAPNTVKKLLSRETTNIPRRYQDMKIAEVRELAVQRGLKTDKMKKTEIIRAIQAIEGNTACFETGTVAECGQANCLWRADCK